MKTQIKLNKTDEKLVKDFAEERNISFKKAIELILYKGVVHLSDIDECVSKLYPKPLNKGVVHLSDIDECVSKLYPKPLNKGVVHPRSITRTITITETVEVK